MKKTAQLARVVFVAVFFVVAASFLFVEPVFAQVQDFGVQELDQSGLSLSGDPVSLIVARIIRAVLSLLGMIAVGIVLYAGYTIMASGGDEERINQGKKILVNGLIGLVIIMSSWAITQFVIRALSDATGSGTGFGNGGRVEIVTFAGSGSLGDVIQDHYPERDARDVPRNTSIIITFANPIAPASFIVDSNNSGVFGDCVAPEGVPLSFVDHCDVLRIDDALDLVTVAPVENPDAGLQIAAIALPRDDGNIRTITLRPVELLGSADADMTYRVSVGVDVEDPQGNSIFTSDRGYWWEFTTDNTLDTTAPVVSQIIPGAGDQVSRNSIIQVTFSEAMDPTAFYGSGQDVLFHRASVTGNWEPSNGYKTFEFVPTAPCGSNSCGDQMFCHELICGDGNDACVEDMSLLFRTGELLATPGQPFATQPLTGVVDAVGNALDGNADGIPDGKPPIGGLNQIDDVERTADNYVLDFSMKNEIDRSAPYVVKVSPALDAEFVPKNEPVRITFSRPILGRSTYDIGIEEYLEDDPQAELVDRLSTYPRLEVQAADGTMTVSLQHREFQPNGIDYFYFTQIPSTVKSLNQNCMYPGFGPVGSRGTSPECRFDVNEFGDVIPETIQNCAQVEIAALKDTGCVETVPGTTERSQENITACIQKLRDVSQSLVP